MTSQDFLGCAVRGMVDRVTAYKMAEEFIAPASHGGTERIDVWIQRATQSQNDQQEFTMALVDVLGLEWEKFGDTPHLSLDGADVVKVATAHRLARLNAAILASLRRSEEKPQ